MQVLKIDYQADNAGQQLTESLHQTGFAVIQNHPITEQSISDFYAEWAKFFLETTQVKQQYIVDPESQQGWIPPQIAEKAKGYDVKDLKEFYNFYSSGVCPESLKIVTENIYQQLLSVGKTLLQWVQTYTPDEIKQTFSAPLDKMIQGSNNHLFRVNYYPELTGNEAPGAMRAAEHTDIDLLTVLTAGSTTGLQISDKFGNWIDVPCEHGNLVINTGDMLQECSAKYFPSTKHRVLNPEKHLAHQPRMSCPMFIHPNDDIKLSERYTASAYLHERLVELGLRK